MARSFFAALVGAIAIVLGGAVICAELQHNGELRTSVLALVRGLVSDGLDTVALEPRGELLGSARIVAVVFRLNRSL